jgi:ankyrin repeat protein
VSLNGNTKLPTTFVDTNTLQFSLSKDVFTYAAPLSIIVVTPQTVPSNAVHLIIETPSPLRQAITKAASFATGSVAPGEIIIIFGTNLDQNVTFDGTPAPLVYFSSAQVNATVPHVISGATHLQWEQPRFNCRSRRQPLVSSRPSETISIVWDGWKHEQQAIQVDPAKKSSSNRLCGLTTACFQQALSTHELAVLRLTLTEALTAESDNGTLYEKDPSQGYGYTHTVVDRTFIRILQSTILCALVNVWAQDQANPARAERVTSGPQNVQITPKESAQLRVGYHEAGKHRLTRPKPIRAEGQARSFHAVEVTAIVDALGSVMSAKATGGPSEWFAEAVSEVKTWKYRPFEENGNPSGAEVTEYVRILPTERLPQTHVPFPEVRSWQSVLITLDRTQCFGPCPDYRVEIHGDGTVRYIGRANVAVPGEHTTPIAREEIVNLVDLFRRADYYSLDPQYRRLVTDNPTYTTSISIDGKTMSVVDYVGEEAGMPQVVTDLEDAIDRAAGTEKWLRASAETLPSLKKEAYDFRSQEAGRTLVGAALYGGLSVVRELIDAGVPVSGKDSSENSALTYAAMRGDPNMLRMLIDAGASKDDVESKTRALLNAARIGSIEIVHMLLDYGARPDTASNNHRMTVLMGAAEFGMPAIVAEILKYRPNVNETDQQGQTALSLACESSGSDADKHADRAAVVRMLVDAGADVNGQDNQGNTALHRVLDKGAARALVQSGAGVNLRNHEGETPLMSTFSEEIARLLVQAGADITARDKAGRTALDLARQRGQQTKARLLESAAAAKL